MKKTNNKSINYDLRILTVLAFGLMFVPFNGALADYTRNNGFNNAVVDTTVERPQTQANNPKPGVSSINPSSGNRGVGTKTITITGSGFVPSSVGRINGSNRATTFIDSSHLLVQTNNTDMSKADGFYITVFNGAPGGGFSDAAFFTIKIVAAPATNTNNSNNSTSDNSLVDTYQETTQPANATSNDTYSDLASNAVFGSNSFLPSGLIQWILFAIIILIIVIVVRKIFGGREKYDEAPMKHA